LLTTGGAQLCAATVSSIFAAVAACGNTLRARKRLNVGRPWWTAQFPLGQLGDAGWIHRDWLHDTSGSIIVPQHERLVTAKSAKWWQLHLRASS